MQTWRRVGSAALRAQLLQCRQSPSRLAHIRIAFIPSVSGEDRRDHAPNFRGLIVVENDSLKASAVPRFDKGPEGINAYFERLSVFARPVDHLAGEATLQDCGGKARRFESDRNPGRKNRIEKLPSITKQGVTWTR